jgi:ribosome recycling factor
VGSDLVDKAQPKLTRAVDFLAEELKAIHTGRAAPALIEDLPVEAYNQTMSVKQLASISATDAKSLTITPWDPTTLAPIEKAIRENKQLDFNPVNDGKSLHINVPALTTERREQLIKQVGEKVESCYISLRNTRHEVLNEAKKLEKAKSIGEDDYNLVEKQITAKIEELRKQIEELAEVKRTELQQI